MLLSTAAMRRMEKHSLYNVWLAWYVCMCLYNDRPTKWLVNILFFHLTLSPFLYQHMNPLHTNPLHVLLRYIHQPFLQSSFPPFWRLHGQNAFLNISTIPALYVSQIISAFNFVFKLLSLSCHSHILISNLVFRSAMSKPYIILR